MGEAKTSYYHFRQILRRYISPKYLPFFGLGDLAGGWKVENEKWIGSEIGTETEIEGFFEKLLAEIKF